MKVEGGTGAFPYFELVHKILPFIFSFCFFSLQLEMSPAGHHIEPLAPALKEDRRRVLYKEWQAEEKDAFFIF